MKEIDKLVEQLTALKAHAPEGDITIPLMTEIVSELRRIDNMVYLLASGRASEAQEMVRKNLS